MPQVSDPNSENKDSEAMSADSPKLGAIAALTHKAPTTPSHPLEPSQVRRHHSPSLARTAALLLELHTELHQQRTYQTHAH